MRRFFALLISTLALFAPAAPAFAVEPILVDAASDRIELRTFGELYAKIEGRLQVETAPGLDGMAGRMTVAPTRSGAQPDWLVFALRNVSQRPLTFWITAERFNVIGSGITWPDLDARRLEAVTPSIGFLPERIDNDQADLFQITIEPGQTITYAVELALEKTASVQLWQPTSYRLQLRDRQLFNGIMLGIAGVLGIFLTAVFAANHRLIFPAAALVAWSVLIFLCVHFGFFHKLFQLRAEDNAVYRAATEAAMAASLVAFLYTFLRVHTWHGFLRLMFVVWLVAQCALVLLAVLEPRSAAAFARMSFAMIAGVGGASILILALRSQDRALALMPPWILFCVWVFGAAMTLQGRLGGELVVSALIAGLVVVVTLIGFTVTQFAFRSSEPLAGSYIGDQALRALAVDGAGAAVWEWQARRDEITVSPNVEVALGLEPGLLSNKVKTFCTYLHPSDRERFLTALGNLRDRNGGTLRLDFRLRHSDNHFRWFNLEAASVPTTERGRLRCCGLMRDITEEKRARDLLLHDAVHDSLTRLPNRELFLDRLQMDLVRSHEDGRPPLAVMLIDLDKFRQVNASYGFVIGDSLLLTLSRRFKSLIGKSDTISRLGGNQFALILHTTEPRALADLAEEVRRAIRAPIQIGGQDIVLRGTIGICILDPGQMDARDALKDAEVAMYRAKRAGPDQIEIFRPEMRDLADDRMRIEQDLRRAIASRQLEIAYQPIINLATEELAGFEALVRWTHPVFGTVNPSDFIPIAEESDLVEQLGLFVLTEAAQEASRWQKLLPRVEQPLFVSVNIASRQALSNDFAREVSRVLGETALPIDGLRLEITESMVMDNPERAVAMLGRLREAGACLALDDFGTGYSSLAYLQRFPFDTLKIDRDIIQAGAEDERGAAIIRSIIALGHELGKKIVAEGVETPEDVLFLRSLGCEFAQGFYYGEAMGKRDVAELLRVVRKAERRFQSRMFKGKSAPPKKARTDEAVAAKDDRAVEAVRPSDTTSTNGARPTKPVRAAAGSEAQSTAPQPIGPKARRVDPAVSRGASVAQGTARPPASNVSAPVPSQPRQSPVAAPGHDRVQRGASGPPKVNDPAQTTAQGPGHPQERPPTVLRHGESGRPTATAAPPGGSALTNPPPIRPASGGMPSSAPSSAPSSGAMSPRPPRPEPTTVPMHRAQPVAPPRVRQVSGDDARGAAGPASDSNEAALIAALGGPMTGAAPGAERFDLRDDQLVSVLARATSGEGRASSANGADHISIREATSPVVTETSPTTLAATEAPQTSDPAALQSTAQSGDADELQSQQLSALPPGIAASLAKLAGVQIEPVPVAMRAKGHAGLMALQQVAQSSRDTKSEIGGRPANGSDGPAGADQQATGSVADAEMEAKPQRPDPLRHFR